MDTFAKHINRKHIFRGFTSGEIVSQSEQDSYYNHTTILIKNLSEFINVISLLTQKSKGTEYSRLVYRGHSDASSNYKLIPSLARYANALERKENVIVDELSILRYDDFQNLSSDFDLLAKRIMEKA